VVNPIDAIRAISRNGRRSLRVARPGAGRPGLPERAMPAAAGADRIVALMPDGRTGPVTPAAGRLLTAV